MSFDKIICVGKNYLEHAKELGDEVPEKPVLFLKPASVLRQVSGWGEQIQVGFPHEDTEVQPECEIALRLAQDGYKMTIEDARNAIADITLGLEMTLRARQAKLKNKAIHGLHQKCLKMLLLLDLGFPMNNLMNI